MGKSMLSDIIRHVLIQRDGYEAVGAESMLKGNAIKHNVSTLNSYHQIPTSDTALKALLNGGIRDETVAAHIQNAYNDRKRESLRRVKTLLQDEVSSLTAPVHEFIHDIHLQWSPHCDRTLIAFGGVHTVQAMDPNQNPPIGDIPYFTSEFL